MKKQYLPPEVTVEVLSTEAICNAGLSVNVDSWTQGSGDDVDTPSWA